MISEPNNIEHLIQNRMSRPLDIGKEEVYKIPVVVHVVHKNSSDAIGLGNNISDEQIYSAIEVLNEDYRRKNADTVKTPAWARPVAADMQVEFILATLDPSGNPSSGITRHYSSQASFNYGPEDEKLLKSFGYWPSDQYLNIWVASLSGGVVGYAQFPDSSSLIGLNQYNGSALTDGVVVAPYACGRLTGLANGSGNPYRYGRTLVHEVGHWLGLKHVFNDSNNGCNYTDYCEDTPKQDKSSIGLSKCDTTILSSCATVVMHSNYMDYTNDFCMNIFTKDQKKRMHTVMELSPRREALKYSKASCGSSNRMKLPFLEGFDAEESVNNWELFVSDSASEWVYDSKSLVAETFKSTEKDSIQLRSGVFEYNKNLKYKLRFDVNATITSSDSIKVYIENSCSERLVKVAKLDFASSGDFTKIISLDGFVSSGLLRFYVVIYANGNTYAIDNISVYEETKSLEVDVFPNPSTGGVFNYKLGLPSEQAFAYDVFDLQGKKQYALESTYYSGYYTMDLSFLKSGTYIVKFRSLDQTKTEKLIIE